MNFSPNLVFLNRSFDKKRLKALLLWFRLNLSEGAALEAVEILQGLGFRSATQGAISLGLDDLKTPTSKNGRVFQAQLEVALAHHEHHRGNRTPVELFQHLVDTWHRTSQDLTTEVVQLFHSTERVNPVYMMAFSGARGNLSQVRQLVGMRGLMADPRGQIVGFPILSNFREGLTITEYFVSCYGARKGVVDTAIRTADAGYLTRRLADVSHHFVVRTTNCGTHRTICLRDIKEGQKTILPLASRLVGRVLGEHIPKIAFRNQEITPDLASKLASQCTSLQVRSPLSCSLRWGVCQLCYGWGLSEGRRVTLGEAVGIIAAQSIGEPGTQLTLRTFHTGGVFSGDLLNEIRAPYNGTVFFPSPLQGLLVRTPHGQIAFLTKVSGKMILSFSCGAEKNVEKENSAVNASSRAKQPFTEDSELYVHQKCKEERLPFCTGSEMANDAEKMSASSHPLQPSEAGASTKLFSERAEKMSATLALVHVTSASHKMLQVTSRAKPILMPLREPKVHVQKENKEFSLQPSTVIFVRQKEQVTANQLLAEFSSSTLQPISDQIEVTQQVLSESAGQVWFKEIEYGNRKGPGSGSLGTHFSSQKLGGVWVLAGKPRSEIILNDRQHFPVNSTNYRTSFSIHSRSGQCNRLICTPSAHEAERAASHEALEADNRYITPERSEELQEFSSIAKKRQLKVATPITSKKFTFQQNSSDLSLHLPVRAKAMSPLRLHLCTFAPKVHCALCMWKMSASRASCEAALSVTSCAKPMPHGVHNVYHDDHSLKYHYLLGYSQLIPFLFAEKRQITFLYLNSSEFSSVCNRSLRECLEGKNGSANQQFTKCKLQIFYASSRAKQPYQVKIESGWRPRGSLSASRASCEAALSATLVPKVHVHLFLSEKSLQSHHYTPLSSNTNAPLKGVKRGSKVLWEEREANTVYGWKTYKYCYQPTAAVFITSGLFNFDKADIFIKGKTTNVGFNCSSTPCYIGFAQDVTERAASHEALEADEIDSLHASHQPLKRITLAAQIQGCIAGAKSETVRSELDDTINREAYGDNPRIVTTFHDSELELTIQGQTTLGYRRCNSRSECIKDAKKMQNLLLNKWQKKGVDKFSLLMDSQRRFLHAPPAREAELPTSTVISSGLSATLGASHQPPNVISRFSTVIEPALHEKEADQTSAASHEMSVAWWLQKEWKAAPGMLLAEPFFSSKEHSEGQVFLLSSSFIPISACNTSPTLRYIGDVLQADIDYQGCVTSASNSRFENKNVERASSRAKQPFEGRRGPQVNFEGDCTGGVCTILCEAVAPKVHVTCQRCNPVIKKLIQTLNLTRRQYSATNRGIFSPLKQNSTFGNFTSLLNCAHIDNGIFDPQFKGRSTEVSNLEWDRRLWYAPPVQAKEQGGYKNQRCKDEVKQFFVIPSTSLETKRRKADNGYNLCTPRCTINSCEATSFLQMNHSLRLYKALTLNLFWQPLSLANYPNKIVVNSNSTAPTRFTNRSLQNRVLIGSLRVENVPVGNQKLRFVNQGKRKGQKKKVFVEKPIWLSIHISNNNLLLSSNIDYQGCGGSNIKDANSYPLRSECIKETKKKSRRIDTRAKHSVLMLRTKNKLEIIGKRKRVEINDSSLDQHIVHTVNLPIVSFPYLIPSSNLPIVILPISPINFKGCQSIRWTCNIFLVPRKKPERQIHLGLILTQVTRARTEKMSIPTSRTSPQFLSNCYTDACTAADNIGLARDVTSAKRDRSGSKKQVKSAGRTYYHSKCGTPIQGELLPLIRQSFWQEKFFDKSFSLDSAVSYTEGSGLCIKDVKEWIKNVARQSLPFSTHAHQPSPLGVRSEEKVQGVNSTCNIGFARDVTTNIFKEKPSHPRISHIQFAVSLPIKIISNLQGRYTSAHLTLPKKNLVSFAPLTCYIGFAQDVTDKPKIHNLLNRRCKAKFLGLRFVRSSPARAEEIASYAPIGANQSTGNLVYTSGVIRNLADAQCTFGAKAREAESLHASHQPLKRITSSKVQKKRCTPCDIKDITERAASHEALEADNIKDVIRFASANAKSLRAKQPSPLGAKEVHEISHTCCYRLMQRIVEYPVERSIFNRWMTTRRRKLQYSLFSTSLISHFQVDKFLKNLTRNLSFVHSFHAPISPLLCYMKDEPSAPLHLCTFAPKVHRASCIVHETGSQSFMNFVDDCLGLRSCQSKISAFNGVSEMQLITSNQRRLSSNKCMASAQTPFHKKAMIKETRETTSKQQVDLLHGRGASVRAKQPFDGKRDDTNALPIRNKVWIAEKKFTSFDGAIFLDWYAFPLRSWKSPSLFKDYYVKRDSDISSSTQLKSTKFSDILINIGDAHTRFYPPKRQKRTGSFMFDGVLDVLPSEKEKNNKSNLIKVVESKITTTPPFSDQIPLKKNRSVPFLSESDQITFITNDGILLSNYQKHTTRITIWQLAKRKSAIFGRLSVHLTSLHRRCMRYKESAPSERELDFLTTFPSWKTKTKITNAKIYQAMQSFFLPIRVAEGNKKEHVKRHYVIDGNRSKVRKTKDKGAIETCGAAILVKHRFVRSSPSTLVKPTYTYLYPGQLVTYGEKMDQKMATTESGQVLYLDSQRATLRKAQTVLIYSQAILSVLSGEWIKKSTPLMALSYQKLVTGDIVQGLPKIEQFFEAPLLKDGTFWSDSLQAKLNLFFQEYRGKFPLAEAVRKGFSDIQRVLVEGVQRVYISQGVLIADKHLEVIVRQMTCKGRILYSGDTGFLRNELVALDKIESVNQVTYGQKALYHPQVRGITDASLESESFLSAASFQETTRVLSRDAVIGKTDLMRGLKERVIVGELIQAGTGLTNNSVYSFLLE